MFSYIKATAKAGVSETYFKKIHAYLFSLFGIPADFSLSDGRKEENLFEVIVTDGKVLNEGFVGIGNSIRNVTLNLKKVGRGVYGENVRLYVVKKLIARGLDVIVAKGISPLRGNDNY